MHNYSLEEVQRLIYQYAKKIDIDKSKINLSCEKSYFAQPYLEIIDGRYHYVINEQGYEITRKVLENVEDFLYYFFESLVSEIAFAYELENRKENQDSRKVAFEKKIELMEKLNPLWKNRLESELYEILSKNPYI